MMTQADGALDYYKMKVCHSHEDSLVGKRWDAVESTLTSFVSRMGLGKKWDAVESVPTSFGSGYAGLRTAHPTLPCESVLASIVDRCKLGKNNAVV